MPSTHTTTYNIFTKPANVAPKRPLPPLPGKPREVPFVDPTAVADGLYQDDNFNAILDAFSRPRAKSDLSNRTVYYTSEQLPASARRSRRDLEDSEEASESTSDSEQDVDNDPAPVQSDEQPLTSPPDDTQQ